MGSTMKRKGKKRLIFFTDIDGSLMNRGDYSWEPARPALNRLQELNIPLVICTSRTRMEVTAIQEEMGITGPIIVENGGGIFFPDGYVTLPVGSVIISGGLRCILLGKPYGRVRSFMDEAKGGFSVRGFGDMSVGEVSELTGLPPDKAALAQAREFTELFVLENEDELPDLELLARSRGFFITRGGRFFHCMGMGSDKGVAVARVQEIFARNWNRGALTVGFGDSPNDFPLLKAVNIPILIPQEDGTFEELDLPGLIRAPHPGSRGWNEAALQVVASKHR